MGLTTPYENMLPPLATAEFEALRISIADHGIRNAVLATEDGRVLDGHHRLKVDPKAPVVSVPGSAGWTDAECVAFVLSSNIERRNLSPDEEADVRRRRIAVARELRRAGFTQDRIARLLRVAQNTLSEWLINNIGDDKTNDKRVRVSKSDYPVIYQRIHDGDLQAQVAADYDVTQPRIAQIVAKHQRDLDQAALNAVIAASPDASPDGPFDVIVADPPWPIQKIDREVREKQARQLDYPTQTVEEITADGLAEVRGKAADDCHLFLWTTQRFLPDSFAILKSWDFRYVLTLVWKKPGGFQPVGLPQYNCEFVLYARRGAPKFTDTKAFPCCFDAPRGDHTEKPEEFYELLRRVTAGRRYDRHSRRAIEGFVSGGNQAVTTQEGGDRG